MSHATCKRRRWLDTWTVSGDICAHAQSGLVVQCGRVSMNSHTTLQRLVNRHGEAAADQMLRRLLREAAEMWAREQSRTIRGP